MSKMNKKKTIYKKTLKNKPPCNLLTKFPIKWLIIVGSSAVIILAAVFLTIHITQEKPSAAFYGFAPKTQNAIIQVIQNTGKKKTKKTDAFTILTYDNTKMLAAEIRNKKADIVFLYNGANVPVAISSAKKNTGFDPSVLNGIISSVRVTAPYNSNNKVSAVPLLLDNCEILVNRSLLQENKEKGITSWTELIQFIQKNRKNILFPVAFAGGDDRSLATITGALTESFGGITAWNTAVKKIQDTIDAGKDSESDFENIIKQLSSTSDGPLYNPMMLLNTWYCNKIISPETFHMTLQDVSSYMENNLSAVIFMTLSDHRTIPQKTIIQFDSFYYPSEQANRLRNFTAPEIIAVPQTKNRIATTVLESLTKDAQEELSKNTGLAPVQAESPVPDRQADDVRYWVAASESPLPSFADELFTNSNDLKAFAEAIRNYVRYR
jgi:hypothetical protein